MSRVTPPSADTMTEALGCLWPSQGEPQTSGETVSSSDNMGLPGAPPDWYERVTVMKLLNYSTSLCAEQLTSQSCQLFQHRIIKSDE